MKRGEGRGEGRRGEVRRGEEKGGKERREGYTLRSVSSIQLVLLCLHFCQF